MNRSSLTTLSTTDLQTRFQAAFGTTTSSRNRPWLIKRLCAAPRTRRPVPIGDQVTLPPAAAVAIDTPAAESPPVPAEQPALTSTVVAIMPPVGSEIRKTWRGQELVVSVQADGFLLNGIAYRSLSAAASALCGGNRNGLVFFGLKPRPVSRRSAGAA